jgi:hypothetical protein
VNCLECAAVGRTDPAVAICVDCGAGICAEHAVFSLRNLTRIEPINRVEVVEPPARVIRCEMCAKTRDAQNRPAAVRRDPLVPR